MSTVLATVARGFRVFRVIRGSVFKSHKDDPRITRITRITRNVLNSIVKAKLRHDKLGLPDARGYLKLGHYRLFTLFDTGRRFR